LTVTVTFICPLLRHVLEGRGQAPPCENPHDLALVLRRPAHVVLGLGGAGGELGRLGEQRVARRLADQRLFGLDGLDVVRRDRGESDPGRGDRAAAVQIEVRRDADGRVVADLALELEVGPAAARVFGARTSVTSSVARARW
jgi:hypothetical protein